MCQILTTVLPIYLSLKDVIAMVNIVSHTLLVDFLKRLGLGDTGFFLFWHVSLAHNVSHV